MSPPLGRRHLQALRSSSVRLDSESSQNADFGCHHKWWPCPDIMLPINQPHTSIDHLRNDIMQHTKTPFPTIHRSNSMWTFRCHGLVGRAAKYALRCNTQWVYLKDSQPSSGSWLSPQRSTCLPTCIILTQYRYVCRISLPLYFTRWHLVFAFTNYKVIFHMSVEKLKVKLTVSRFLHCCTKV